MRISIIGRIIVGLVQLGLFALLVYGLVFLKSFLEFREISSLIRAIPSLITVAIFFFSGLHGIPEEQRWLVTFFGEYYGTFSKGLRWICPIFLKIKTFVSVWEQRYPLFLKPTEEVEGKTAKEPEEIKIDFLDGSATPRGAFVFVKCNEEQDPWAPYKMVWVVKNISQATASLVEGALRTFLNKLKVANGIMLGRGGADVLQELERKSLGKKVIERIRMALYEWGLRMTKITIKDWDLDEMLIRARTRVTEEEQEKKASTHQARRKALQSGGMHAEIKKLLVEEYGYPEAEAEKIAAEYVKYWQGSTTGTLVDFRTSGEDLISFIAKIITAVEAVKKTGK